MLSRTTKRAMAVTMSLALAAGSIGFAPKKAWAATEPSLSNSGITVKVGAKKTVKIKKGSYTIKSVNVKPADNDYVDLEWNKKKVVVEGENAGKCKLKVIVKAQLGKGAVKKFKLPLEVTVKNKSTDPTPAPTSAPATPTPAPTAAPSTPTPTPGSSAITVYTQADLDAALAGGKKQITIGQNANNYLVIGTATYKDVDLTINAPNAAVTNYATFKSITIQAIKYAFTECGNGNAITLTANTTTKILVDAGGNTVSSLSLTGVPANNSNHSVEIKNGTVNTLNLGAQVRANVLVSNSSSVKSLNMSAASAAGISVNNSAQISAIVLKDDAQFSINGNTNKRGVVDLTAANNNARANIYSPVVDYVSSMESLNVTNVVTNKTNESIKNIVKRANGTTYETSIAPSGDQKTTISIAVQNVNVNDTQVCFYLKTPSTLDLTNSAFQFSVRKGSSTGTVVNTNKYAIVNGVKPYYLINCSSGLTAGTYYITLSTTLSYVLASTSFTIGSGPATPTFPVSNFKAGSTMGTTKLTNVDTSTLEYFVDNNASVAYPDYMNWQNFNKAQEIAISTGQYVHVRKMSIGSQGPSGVADYAIADSQIRGEVQRVAAASAVGAVASEAYMNGDFTISNLYTAQRWWKVDDLVDTALSKINDYINAGATDAMVRALPNYSTYADLIRQKGNTGSKLIVDIDFSEQSDWPLSSTNVTDAIAELTDDMRNTAFRAITGNEATVALSVTAWDIGASGYSPEVGAVNLFVIKTISNTNYVIATDVLKGKGIYALNVPDIY